MTPLYPTASYPYSPLMNQPGPFFTTCNSCCPPFLETTTRVIHLQAQQATCHTNQAYLATCPQVQIHVGTIREDFTALERVK